MLREVPVGQEEAVILWVVAGWVAVLMVDYMLVGATAGQSAVAGFAKAWVAAQKLLPVEASDRQAMVVCIQSAVQRPQPKPQ